MLKFCKDCKFYNSIDTYKKVCAHTSGQGSNYLVSGEDKDLFLCVSNRSSDCGKDAKFFEPKE